MIESGCEFCRGEFEDTVICEFEYWEVQLFKDQSYLGRSLIKLKRHAVDLTDLNQNEREELFENVLPMLQDSLDTVFNPDLYNQATLGNDCRHFHLHVIPRYQDEREFEEIIFRDENWNSHYKNQESSLELSDNIFQKIKLKIRNEINDE